MITDKPKYKVFFKTDDEDKNIHEVEHFYIIDRDGQEKLTRLPVKPRRTHLQCCIIGCNNVPYHIADEHKCISCNDVGHDVLKCPIKKWDEKIIGNVCFGRSESKYKDEKYLKIEAFNRMNFYSGKIYVMIYAGSGKHWYAKRDDYGKKIKLFYNNSGNNAFLNSFLHGYTLR